jgi:hypothetical protein
LAPFLRSLALSNKVANCFAPQSNALASKKGRKRIKGGAVKVVNKEIQRTSRWLSAAKAG